MTNGSKSLEGAIDAAGGHCVSLASLAESLEARYYMVPFADLPKVEIYPDHVRAGGRTMFRADPADLRREAHEVLALAQHFESVDNPQQRIAQEYGLTSIDHASGMAQDLINRLVELQTAIDLLRKEKK